VRIDAAPGPTTPATPAPHCPGCTAKRRTTLESKKVAGIAPLHVAGQLWLSGQPTAEGLAAAKAAGVTAVVNLRLAQETADFDERELAAELGLKYANPGFSAASLSDADFDRLRTFLVGAQKPTLVHCSSGNRVGAVWLVHRVVDAGLNYGAALTEAREIGLRSPELEAKARAYIERVRAQGTHAQ